MDTRRKKRKRKRKLNKTTRKETGKGKTMRTRSKRRTSFRRASGNLLPSYQRKRLGRALIRKSTLFAIHVS